MRTVASAAFPSTIKAVQVPVHVFVLVEVRREAVVLAPVHAGSKCVDLNTRAGRARPPAPVRGLVGVAAVRFPQDCGSKGWVPKSNAMFREPVLACSSASIWDWE